MAEIRMKGLNGVTYTGIMKLLGNELNKQGIILLSKDFEDEGDGESISLVIVNSVYPEQYKSRVYVLPSEESDPAKRPILAIDITGNLDAITIRYNIIINSVLNTLGFKLECNDDDMPMADHSIEMITRHER